VDNIIFNRDLKARHINTSEYYCGNSASLFYLLYNSGNKVHMNIVPKSLHNKTTTYPGTIKKGVTKQDKNFHINRNPKKESSSNF
jgi:hypothetical protein